MSLFGTLDRSTSSTTVFQVGSRSLFALLCPSIRAPNPPGPLQRRRVHQLHMRAPSLPLRLPSPQDMDDFFVSALVRASTCHEHSNHAKHFSTSARPWPLAPSHQKVRRKGGTRPDGRTFHSDKPGHVAAEGAIAQVSREELRNLVDIYGEWGKAPTSPSQVVHLGPAAIRGLGEEFFTESDTCVLTGENFMVRNIIQKLERLLGDNNAPPDRIFELYKSLPLPRASYLPRRLFSDILHHLADVPRKTEQVMMQYLSILEDMKASQMPIKLSQWNTAIHLAGRYVGSRATMSELETSLSFWKEMETEAGIKGDKVTFSILFDIAVKAEKYILAESIHKESIRRGLELDRLSRMAQIFYFGVRRDGIGVRRAYLELVEAGEIVNTSVLTNVIAGLISAGELPAAEETFQRMKLLHAEKTGATTPPDNWHDVRQLRKILTVAGNRYRQDVDKRRTFQDASPIAPDSRTYQTFIKFHANESGNIDRLLELLEEMDTNGIRLTGPIFFWVFVGFQNHGGIRYSSWRKSRLELLWGAFLQACDERPFEIYLEHGVAIAAVWAFHKCASRERVQDVWADIRTRWKPTGRTLHLVNNILKSRLGDTTITELIQDD